ncbi:MAG TPA: SDR family NAD(P)-dependent oxidoreductase [Thermoanaerobaculia bacterium]
MSNVAIDLTGKVALITGASRGIGRETARRLAEAGASVGINYVQSSEDAKSLAAEIGADHAALLPGDVGDPEAVRAIVDGVADRFGRLDILVNNAAVYGLNRFDSADYESWKRGWRRTIDVNLFGAANAAFLALPHMRRQGGGRIINVASRAAFRGEIEFPDYGASKAGLVNLTHSLARACSRENIIATCVAPGFVETDMAEPELSRRRNEILEEIPLGRIGTVDDVTGVILFLASPLAGYLAGATIDVNGGSYLR